MTPKHGTHSAYVHLRCRCDPCCIAEKSYQQGYRDANRERLQEYDRSPERDSRLRDDPEKRRVREMTRAAIDTGALARRPCESCGSTPSQAHHDDYEQPLAVRWLCSACHGIEHRKPNTARAAGRKK